MAYPSGWHDPDGRVEGVEDNSGRGLRIEIGGFLGHHLAGPRYGDHVRNGRGPDKEGGLGLPRRHPVKNGVDVPGIADIPLLFEQELLQTELASKDLPMKDGHVELGDWVGRCSALDVDGRKGGQLPTPTLPA